MRRPRLYVGEPLIAGATPGLEDARAHYVAHVLRQRAGDAVQVFNDRDGEWLARITHVRRHRVELIVETRRRPPQPEPGPALVVAPIRQSRFDWLVEKAVELGVASIQPVLTTRTVVRPDRVDRLRALAIEAAEQCGRLSSPVIHEPLPLTAWLRNRQPGPALLLADETGGGVPLPRPLESSSDVELLIGPEGGFTDDERRACYDAGALAVDLGPTILRAETAALYAIACWRAAWNASSGSRLADGK